MDYAIFLGGFIADFVRQSVQACDILDDEEACAELRRVQYGKDIVAEVVDPVVEDGIEIIMSTVSPWLCLPWQGKKSIVFTAQEELKVVEYKKWVRKIKKQCLYFWYFIFLTASTSIIELQGVWKGSVLPIPVLGKEF